MLTLSKLKKTQVAQEAFAEGKDEGKEKANLKSVSKMIRLG